MTAPEKAQALGPHETQTPGLIICCPISYQAGRDYERQLISAPQVAQTPPENVIGDEEPSPAWLKHAAEKAACDWYGVEQSGENDFTAGFKSCYRASSDRWAQRVAELASSYETRLDKQRESMRCQAVSGDGLVERVATLTARIERLREALQYYAQWFERETESKNKYGGFHTQEDECDSQARSIRAALAADDKERT